MSNPNRVMRPSDELYGAFTDAVNGLRAEGLVDCKFKIDITPETTTETIIRVMQNALCLRAMGKLEPVDFLQP